MIKKNKNKLIIILLIIIEFLLFFLSFKLNINILLFIILIIILFFINCLIIYILYKIPILNFRIIINKIYSKKIQKHLRKNEDYMKKIKISTFDGSGSMTHPSILYFESKYANYEYWMAFTPYDNNNVELENPSILVSHDGINFIEYPNIVNPLLPIIKKQIPNKYYSDPFLFYNNDRIELWYRVTIEYNGLKDSIYRIIIDNNGNLSKPELMLNDNNEYLSLSIIKLDNKYIMYSFNTKNQIQIMESSDLKNWSNMQLISNKNYNFWHGEARLIDNKIWFLIITKNNKLLITNSNKFNYNKIDKLYECKFYYSKNSFIDIDFCLYKSSILKIENSLLFYIPYRIKKLYNINSKKLFNISWELLYSKIDIDNIKLIYKGDE